MKFKLFLQWLSKQSILFMSSLLLGIVAIFILFFTSGQPRSIEQVAVGIAAISAFFSSISAIASLSQAAEIQKQREDQERPYIITYFDATNNGALYFVIENNGNSPAYDIKFKFKSAPIDYANRSLDKVSLFNNPITFLPAGKSLRQIVNATFRFFEKDNSTSFSFSVSYRSVSGVYFYEKLEHDLEYLRQVTLPVKTIGEHLGDVSQELKNLSRNIDKLINTNSLQTRPTRKRLNKKASKSNNK